MLFMLRLVAIAAILFAANLNLFSQQDTSGWVQSGNVWLNKHEIGTIKQAGLSSTGDSIWTFSDDDGYFFRIWELKSGMMIFEKQFGPKYIISRDFQTYYYDEPANFKLYDLKTDTLILEKDLERGRIEYSHDCFYDINRSLLFVACSYINPGQGRSPAHIVNEMLVSKVQNSTIVSTINMTQYFITKGFMLNRDRTWIASIRYTPNFYDIEKNKYYEIGQRPSHTSIVRFTSNPYHLAALESDNYMCIWQVQSRGLISRTQLKLGNIGTYCFSEQDKFIAAVSNKRFYLLASETGTVIDSTEYYPYQGMRLLQDKSLHGFVFVSENKFGLVNFDILGNNDVVQFTSDSTYLYLGGTTKLYNLSNFEYDSIEWELSDGRKSSDTNPSFKFETPGFFDVKLSLSKDGELLTLTKENFIEVYQTLSVDFDSDVKYGKSPLTVQFEDKSSGIVDEYIWKVNGEVFSNEKNPKYVFTEAGRYNISLTVTDKYSSKEITKPYFINVDRQKVELVEIVSEKNYEYAITFFGKYAEEVFNFQTFQDKDTLFLLASYAMYYTTKDVSSRITIDLIESFSTKSLNRFSTRSFDQDLFVTNNSNLLYLGNSFLYTNGGLVRRYDVGFVPADFTQLHKITILSNPSSKTIHIPIKMDKRQRLTNFDMNSFVMAGTDKLGDTKIFKLTDNLEIINEVELQEGLIDIFNLSTDKLLLTVNDDINNEYFYCNLDPSLAVTEKNLIEIPKDFHLNDILKLSSNRIAFCGSNNELVAVIGVTDLSGKLIWTKSFSDWQTFDKLYLNENNFIVTGTSYDKDIGFVEINQFGTEYVDNRYPASDKAYLAAINVISKDEVILTHSLIESTKYTLSKVRYNSLTQNPGSVDSTTTNNLSHSILPVPNPAENSVTLQFEESQIVQKVQVYDYSGIEVMQFTLPKSPVYEVLLPLHALSTGMYHVTVTTDSGILRTKFIKY